MLRILTRSRLSDRFRLILVATYRDGSKAAKAAQAARGLSRLAGLLLLGRVDVIHIHAASGASLVRKALALLMGHTARRPVVLHLHDGAFESQFRRGGLRGRLRARLTIWSLERADAVVVLTNGSARAVEAKARIRRIRVIPNVPDLPKQPRRDGAANERPMLLYLGHLLRLKGVFELVDAVALLRPHHPGLRVVFAGDGPEAADLRRHAEQMQLPASAIEFSGWVDPDEKARLLANASCLVLPSHREGLPLSVLEAMSCGVPVVATHVGGIPEAIRDGVEGLLVAPKDPAALADAVGRVLDEPALGTRLADAAARRASNEYTPASLTQQVASLYDEMLERL
jgi:glycosyltransferase involved in cell wall biosynthesis